ncbi:unnamed protein product [Rotaria socialis]|uniref:Uncharacterized protein n=1 Tax=Rotaria socialis TaxID=392032 RepID=A0A821E849_9BILA|nr:unnamed protein product [Rotaria socialis]CAF3379523.1 unnamed protein product [Rotaria socialis]CAF3405752.1 unnamed protein product [Rotaria socialis]CAF3450542.1 unnamed protein product [Rotaria socialis]CAF3582685.1 unnamed protein product [Rotaria socialis]
MSSKRQQLSLKISNWTEQNVQVRKCTPNIGAMPKDAKQNVMLSRQFFSNMINLSSERFRKISRLDHDKKKFLLNQRTKAERGMPGLLPYIDPLIENINNDRSSSRRSKNNESLYSSSFQSFATMSNTKSEFSSALRQQSPNKKKIPPPTPQKYFDRPEKSVERKTSLSHSKHQYHNSKIKNHVRPNYNDSLTVDDLFGELDDDDDSNYFSPLPEKPKSATKDKRFRQLIHLFSEVHECDPTNLKTIKNVIESNSSLRNEQKHWQTINIQNSPEMDIENHEQLSTDEFYTKTDVYLIDMTA